MPETATHRDELSPCRPHRAWLLYDENSDPRSSSAFVLAPFPPVLSADVLPFLLQRQVVIPIIREDHAQERNPEEVRVEGILSEELGLSILSNPVFPSVEIESWSLVSKDMKSQANIEVESFDST